MTTLSFFPLYLAYLKYLARVAGAKTSRTRVLYNCKLNNVALTREEPRHDLFAELLAVADAERLPRAGPPDRLGVLPLEDLEQTEGERLPAAALAEALLALLWCGLLRIGSSSSCGLRRKRTRRRRKRRDRRADRSFGGGPG